MATNRMFGLCTASHMAFRVVTVVLVGLHIWLHVARGHRLHRMPHRFERSRPMVRAGACLHADQAGTQASEESVHLRAAQSFAQHRMSTPIDCVDPEGMFGKINAYGANIPFRVPPFARRTSHVNCGTSVPRRGGCRPFHLHKVAEASAEECWREVTN